MTLVGADSEPALRLQAASDIQPGGRERLSEGRTSPTCNSRAFAGNFAPLPCATRTRGTSPGAPLEFITKIAGARIDSRADYLFSTDGSAKQKSLCQLAATIAQELDLLLSLDALGNKVNH